MAAIDYHGILEAMEAIFVADERTAHARVFVEQDPQFGMSDNQQALVLSLVRRLPSSGQSMAAGTRTRYDLSVSVWCVGFSAESFNAAAKIRDALMAQAELVLMDNRSITTGVDALQLEGGEFMSYKDDNGMVFCALAETVVRLQVSAIT